MYLHLDFNLIKKHNFGSNQAIKSNVNRPVCVAEVNILKLHFSQFVDKTPCIYFIFYLRKRTNTENIKKTKQKRIIIQRLK